MANQVQQTVYRGTKTACVWSGSLLTNAALTGAPGAVQSGGHIQLFSGAGRLNSVFPHQQMQSGQQVIFYDAGSISVSGISASGQVFLARIPSTWETGVPGIASGGLTNPNLIGNGPTFWDAPFSSGLCVAAASGTPGFTVSYTPGL